MRTEVSAFFNEKQVENLCTYLVEQGKQLGHEFPEDGLDSLVDDVLKSPAMAAVINLAGLKAQIQCVLVQMGAARGEVAVREKIDGVYQRKVKDHNTLHLRFAVDIDFDVEKPSGFDNWTDQQKADWAGRQWDKLTEKKFLEAAMYSWKEPSAHVRLDAIYRGRDWDEVTSSGLVPVKVVEMRLCEQSHVVLKPDQLYRFTVDTDCEKCRHIANICHPERPGS